MLSRSSIGARRGGVIVALLLLSSGCAHYVPRPLSLPANVERLDARTLTDEGLAQTLQPSSSPRVWPPPVWDLPALTIAALYYHPDLEIARANWALARAGLISAGARPNPSVAAGPGFNSSTPAETITPWILTLDLDFTIETAGKRGFRIAQAQALSDAARFTIAATAWNVRTGVRQALLDLFAATQAAAVLDRQRSIQERNVTLLQRQLTAGAISAFEMTQARLALDAIRLQYVDAQRRQADARAQLATAIGIPVSALEGIEFGLDAFASESSDIAAEAATREALLNRADVLSALAEYDASQSALQIEIARQYPDIHLGPGYQMDQDSNKWTILAPFVLPAFNRNQGPIAEAEARRSAVAAQVTAAQARAIGAVDRALTAYRTGRDALATVDQLFGQVRSLEMTAEAQLAAGEISQLDLGLIQGELASRELSRLDARVQVQQAIGDLEDAMQRPIDVPVHTVPETVPLAPNPSAPNAASVTPR